MSQSETKLTLKSLAAELGVTSGTVQRAAAVYERLRGEPLARQGRETVLTPQQSAHLRRAVQLAHRYGPGLERVLTEELAKSQEAVGGGSGGAQDSGVSPDELQVLSARVKAYQEAESSKLTVGRLMVEASPFNSPDFFGRFSETDVRRVLCEIVTGLRGGSPFAFPMKLTASEYQLLQEVAERLDWEKVMAVKHRARHTFALEEVERILKDLTE